MKKRGILLGLLMTSALALSSCVSINKNTTTSTEPFGQANPFEPVNPFDGENSDPYNPNNPSETIVPSDASSAEATDPEESKVEINDSFTLINSTTNTAITSVDGIYTIDLAGEYVAKGKLDNGMIYVNAPESEVIINLAGVSMTSNINSCIYVNDASKVEISANKDTYNEIIDNRDLNTTVDEAEEALGSAAIYSLADLKIKGKGSLVVKSTYNNGIHTKDDLDIKNVNLKVTALNNCLKGNDSVNIESGELILVSTSGDGIKTTNSDVSEKGNQRGTVTITGGIIDIYSCCDGIDAAYDIDINQVEGVDSPTINIHTSNYSSYTDDVIQKSTTQMYIKIPQSYSTYRYALYFYNVDEEGVFVDATYEGVTQGRTRYYYYSVDVPTGYSNVMLYAFNQNSEDSLENYLGVSGEGTINDMYDTLQLSSFSNGMIKYTWTMNTLNQTQGGMTGGNSNKLDYSAKGFKSYNNININAGNITIESTDDAIHANRGEALENGTTGEGSVNLNGGTIIATSKDDAIHADYILTIDGANVNIKESYEGLEANQVLMKSGYAKVVAQDDGVNASGSYLSVLVNVTGGFLDVAVASGDTDGIDSNGSYTQSGGFVVTKTQATGGGCGALDVDGTITVTGGTIVAAGAMEALPSSSSVNYVKFGQASQMGGMPGFSTSTGGSVTFTSGSYTVYDSSNNSLFSFDFNYNYTNMWIASDQFVKNQSYTLKNSTTTYSWTQSSQAVSGN